MAATAGYATGTNSTFASNLFGDAALVVSNPAAFTISSQATDNFIGRTTGFGVRLTLGNGARFANTSTAPVLGGALTGYTVGFATTIPAAGSSTMLLAVNAGAGANINVGSLLEFPTDAIDLRNLTALSSGGSIPVSIELFDSNTATVFSTFSATLLTSAEGTTVAFDPQQGDVNKRIDVARCPSPAPAVEPRRRFSPSGAVGNSCQAADTDRLEFNAGAITVGITQIANGTPSPIIRANGFTGSAANVNGTGGFQYAATDIVNVTITGANFAAFNAATGEDRIYLAGTSACDLAGAVPATGKVINAGNNSITLETTAADWGGVTGGTRFVCVAASAAAATQIATQALSASVEIDFVSDNVLDPSNRSGDLLPLRNNGTVLEFQNVNPAGNAQAQSFVRLTNTGSLACPVTLSAFDDAGAAGAAPITFSLAANNSVTFNSIDLESGSTKGTGAFGDGAGRWYLTATGECAGLVGSALNRNTTDGTVTNLTPDKR